MARKDLGKVHLYTGDGKGKTTAALGLGLRAAARGLKVLMVQFMKTEGAYGEQWVCKDIPGLEIRPMGLDCLIHADAPRAEDIAIAGQALALAARAMASGDYDVVILDEVCVAVKWNLVREDDVLHAIRSRAEGVEVVMTGRYAPASFVAEADLVTEMRCVKHYFDQGLLARDGIER